MEKDFATPSRDAGPSMATGSGAADSALPEETQPPKPPGQHAVSVLWSFGKCLATLLPVYLAGYFGFSITLVLFGLMVYMGWTHSRNEKVMRLRSAMHVLENERAYATARAFRSKRELPPWVSDKPILYCVFSIGSACFCNCRLQNTSAAHYLVCNLVI